MKPFEACLCFAIGAFIGEVTTAYVFSHSVDIWNVFSASAYAGLALYFVKIGLVKA